MESLPTLYKNNSTGTGWWKIIPVLNPSNPGYQITYAKSKNAKAVKKFHPTFAKNIGRANQTTAEEQTKAKTGDYYVLCS